MIAYKVILAINAPVMLILVKAPIEGAKLPRLKMFILLPEIYRH